MLTSLLDAKPQIKLIIHAVQDPALAIWLKRLGLTAGSPLLRHAEEAAYHPVRIRTGTGDFVVPAGMGMKIFVHSNNLRKPLVEMARGEKARVEAMTCGQQCEQGLARFGLALDQEIECVRPLPHMDYITRTAAGQRTRLSEGEAARILGRQSGEEDIQFYFAARNKPFTVTALLGGRGSREHLASHGVEEGCGLLLEGIVQAAELHKPVHAPVTISSEGGLRLYLSPAQAGKIMVAHAPRAGHEER